ARGMQQQGYEVHVASPEGAERRLLEEAGFVFHPIPLHRGSLNPWTEFKSIYAIGKVMREVRPSIVHAMRLKGIVYGGLAARWLGLPAIVYGTTGLGYTFATRGMFPGALRMALKRGFRAVLCHPNCLMVVENPDDEMTLRDAGYISPG